MSLQQHYGQIPHKVIVLLSSGSYYEQGFKVERVELRWYLKRRNDKLGTFSTITTNVETDKGSIELVFDEGYRGPNAVEEVAAFLTSHPLLSQIILHSVLKLKSIQKEKIINNS